MKTRSNQFFERKVDIVRYLWIIPMIVVFISAILNSTTEKQNKNPQSLYMAAVADSVFADADEILPLVTIMAKLQR